MSADILPMGVDKNSNWTPILKATDALVTASYDGKGLGVALSQWAIALGDIKNKEMREICIEVAAEHIMENPPRLTENAPDV
jgi:hypothetical protein